MRNNQKTGSITIFITIIMVSVIVLMSILLSASNIREREALVSSAMIQQQDLLLSNYSEILLDRYGIFATKIENDYSNEFITTVKGFPEVYAYNAKGEIELDGDTLVNAISDFSKPRFPVVFAVDMIERFSNMSSVISENKFDLNVFNNTDETDFLDDDKNNELNIDYSKIIEILSMLNLDDFKNDTEENSDEEIISFENLNELIKTGENKELLFDSKYINDLKTNITKPEETLNSISNYIEKLFLIDTPQIYDRISFEIYISKMFSCKTNYMIVNGQKQFTSDMRNRKLDDLYFKDSLELEKIIFWSENANTNNFFTKTSIISIRTLLNIISNFIDKTKLSKTKSQALFLCSIIAVVSSGTIIIPKNAMEVVLIILKSIYSSYNEYNDLIEGKGVELLPFEFKYNIETYYKDYLFIFQLLVPKHTKALRIKEIINNNIYNNSKLYVGLSVSCKFRNSNYTIFGNYYEQN